MTFNDSTFLTAYSTTTVLSHKSYLSLACLQELEYYWFDFYIWSCL